MQHRRHQRQQGALAGAGAADDRHRLAGRDLELDAGHDRRLIGGVGKAQIAEPELAGEALDADQGLAIADRRLGVEDGDMLALEIDGTALELNFKPGFGIPRGCAGVPVGLPGLPSIPGECWLKLRRLP